jgi:parvulin-like peptidyl-prolyl isomerase
MWSLAACSPGVEVVLEPGVVARIDSTSISAAEMRDFVVQMPQSLRLQGQGDPARKRYLHSMLAKYLLVLEAKERGLDTAQVVQTKVMHYWRQHLVDTYRQLALAPNVQVSEEEVGAYFAHSGLDRKRQMAGILVEEDSTAKQIYEQLETGEDFAQLAAEYTIDERSASQGGILGFIDLEQARRLQIPDEVFRSLPSGQLSPILPMGTRYQIVRFLQDQPVPLAEKRQQIRDILYERKRLEQERAETATLARKLDVQLVPEGLEILLDKAALHTRVRLAHLTDEEVGQPLFTYDGGQIALGDYLNALWKDMRALSGWGVRDSAEVIDTARELVLMPALLAEAAQRAGLEEMRDGQQRLAEIRTEFMIKQLRQEEVIDQSEASQEEARDFYDDNEELFREPAQYIVVEVLVETEVEAAGLLHAITQGATLGMLAQKHTIRPGMKKEDGLLHLGEYERLTLPRLFKAVKAADLNKITGPEHVEGGYSIFKVLNHQGGELSPFFQVEKKARALVRGQKREQLFEDLIDDLLDKYEERIAVSDSALAAALPDAFLQRHAWEAPTKGE